MNAIADKPATAEPVVATFFAKVEKSSQVCFCTYDPATLEMSVIYRGTPGTKYVYKKYPPEMWDAIKASPSIGSFLYRNVTRPLPGDNKAPYEFERVPVPAGTMPPQPAEVP